MKQKDANSLFSEVIDYEIDAQCVQSSAIIPYLFRSYLFGKSLYITDIFPKMWENENDCFKRIISREGYAVNMRRLSVTCLYIFFHHHAERDATAIMVVSGSYEPQEDEAQVSRKLRLYWAFFQPLFETLSIKAVKMFDLNAFALLRKDNPISEEQIINHYKLFKSQQKNNNINNI